MNEASVFDAALQLASPAERVAYLDRACAGEPALRQAVEELLAAHQASNLLDRPALDLGQTGAYQPRSHGHHPAVGRVSQVIAGRYKLIELIGQGGMGEVWMAQQTEPVKRAVAVKLIREGMDSKTVLARFEAERQALALMDHPNIAKVLDAGLHEGKPFFVMELVKGIPIVEFCDQRKLTPRDRLELFVPVCHAIQHAHQKGIIHRDIKPSNVLVALFDDRPVPKVIDFGVAKATSGNLTEQTLMTGFGAIVGTPEYMSPEQASFNQWDIDTRSDVYTLGVLLYELLTGTTPIDRKSLGNAAIMEILRLVREVEAPRPSAKLSTNSALPTISANRSTEPARLTGLLRNELDWIVMKALEKDRTRRYETANGLAKDVQRYLAGDAVEACPPTLGYRLRKAYRRNRSAVLVGSGFACFLAVGVVLTTLLAIQARQAELAAKDHAEAASRAESEAVAQRDAARAANYQTNIALAAAALDDGQVELTRVLLERTRPLAGEEDRRGFEWYYLMRGLHAEDATIPVSEPVVECALAPGSQTLAVAVGREWELRDKGAIELWNLPEQRRLRTIALDGKRCLKLAFNSDGTLLAGDIVQPRDVRDQPRGEAEVRLWDTKNGQLRGTYSLPMGGVQSLSFSPDGQRLAVSWRNYSTRAGGFVTLDVAKSLREISTKTFNAGWGDVVSAYNAQGQLLVAHSFGADHAARLLNMATGTESVIFDPRTVGSETFDVFLTPDATQLSVSTVDQTVRLWDLTGPQPRLSCTIPSTGMNTGAALFLGSTGGPCVLINRHQSSVAKVWDTRNGQRTFVARGHTDSILCATLSEDGQTLVTGSEDRTVKRWRLPTVPKNAVFANLGVRGVAARADGGFSSLTYADRSSDANSSTFMVRDVATGQTLMSSVKRGPEVNSQQRQVRLSPDGSRVATLEWHTNGRVLVWDVKSNQLLPGWPSEGIPGERFEFMTPDKLAVIQANNELWIWDLTTAKPTGQKSALAVDPEGFSFSLVRSHDARFLAIMRPKGVCIWDTQTDREVRTVTLADSKQRPLALNHDGRCMAVLDNQTILLLDTTTGAVRQQLRGHFGWIRCAIFSPDGKRLFSGASDHAVKVWDTTTGLELLTLRHNHPIVSLATSPDGYRLVTQQNWDGRGRIFDATPQPD